MVTKSLQSLGWDAYFQEQLLASPHNNYFPARVVSQFNDLYHLLSENGDSTAKVTGKFRYAAKQLKEYPVVGDFVLVEPINDSEHLRIHTIMPRKNYFSRKLPISGGRKMKNGVMDGGVTEEQIIAANIDTVFIMCGMDGNFNLARMERYLTLARHQKLEVIILLNKIDLCEEPETYIAQVKEIANGVAVLPISASKQIGLALLLNCMADGKTIVFLGSSGVGKSTLLNSLLEHDVQTTSLTSKHSGKGKHTTTHRQMFFHPSGCMIIDTPGMKELQLWAEEEDLGGVFPDVLAILSQCKFSNCTHKSEPGCALQPAIASGVLSRERYKRYLDQLLELTRLEEKQREYLHKHSQKNKQLQ